MRRYPEAILLRWEPHGKVSLVSSGTSTCVSVSAFLLVLFHPAPTMEHPRLGHLQRTELPLSQLQMLASSRSGCRHGAQGCSLFSR